MNPVLELYYAPHCPRCAAARRLLARLCAEHGLTLEECNVLEHLQRAAALGIRATPSLVIDGRVVASGGLDEDTLQHLLTPQAPLMSHSIGEVSRLTEAKLRQIEQRLQDLTLLRNELTLLLHLCQDGEGCGYPIIERLDTGLESPSEDHSG